MSLISFFWGKPAPRQVSPWNIILAATTWLTKWFHPWNDNKWFIHREIRVNCSWIFKITHSTRTQRFSTWWWHYLYSRIYKNWAPYWTLHYTNMYYSTYSPLTETFTENLAFSSWDLIQLQMMTDASIFSHCWWPLSVWVEIDTWWTATVTIWWGTDIVCPY